MEAFAIIIGGLLLIGFCVIIYTPFSRATKQIIEPNVVLVETDYNLVTSIREPSRKSGFTDKQWDHYQHLLENNNEPVPVWNDYEGEYLIDTGDEASTERYASLKDHYILLKECYEEV